MKVDGNESRWGSDYAIEVRSIKGNQLIARFTLPKFTQDPKIRFARVCTSKISAPGDRAFAPFRFPFATSPFPQLLLLTIKLRGSKNVDKNADISFVVLTEVFNQTREQVASWPNKEVPWDVWGPANTRVFKNEPIRFEAYMHKVCTRDSILDFNPVDIARDLCRSQIDGICAQPTILTDIFAEEVLSFLPFRRTKHLLGPVPGDETELHPILAEPLIGMESDRNRISAFI
jgi:hypothetical protein